MNRSSTRRSLSRTSSSSPGTLRRLRSTVRKVQFSDSVRNKKNSNDKNKSNNSQQLTPANNEEIQTTNDLTDQEMTPSNLMNSMSLSDQETSNTTTNQMTTNDKSPSISDSEEENGDSSISNGSNMNNSENQQISNKTKLLTFFEEWENHDGYKCKLCQTDMNYNLHLLVKPTVIPFKKKTTKSSNTSKLRVTTDHDSQSELSTDDDSNSDDYSTSEEEEGEGEEQRRQFDTDLEQEVDDENETSNDQPSTDEDENSSTSEDEQDHPVIPVNVLTDPTLIQIRLIIKRVRELVGIVNHSSNLHEYIRQQKKKEDLPGDGLIMDCDTRWNTCYLMIDRFISYQSVIENITILHRNIISDLSSPLVKHLKKLIFTDEEWDYLVATRNVLSMINDACKLLSGKKYETLSIGYLIICGLKNSLLKPSKGPQASIENIIKKYLYDAFQYHFDQKLSIDQKEAMLIVTYLNPYSYRRMIEADKIAAEKIVIAKLNENSSAVKNRDDHPTNPVQQKATDLLDSFLEKCGLTTIASTTSTTSRRQRSAKEEIAFYVDRVHGNISFEKFWNQYKNELPRMMDLVKAYNMRPVTSVPSEGLFSIANYVQRKNRASLAPKTLKYTMVLRDQKILSDLLDSMNQ